MNIQDTANTKSAYAIGQPVKRKEDGKLLRGQGRYTDDVNLPNQAYAYILRSTIAHGRIKSINTEAAKTMPGVLAHLHRRGPDGLRHAAVGAAVQEQGRHRPEEAAAAGAADRQGALRRRSDRLRGGRDAGAGQGCLRGDRGRYRGAAGHHHAGPGGRQGRAGDLRRRAGQRLPRLPLRRHREGRTRRSPAPSTRSSSSCRTRG